ncbi:MAG: RHS repeat-associated core domain-containing protein, partial [Cyanobacteria bacterium SBC]|nr:RHS repeat-associated core domain-containing protein [Cyanobacteria bacterium SBC]
SNRPYAQVLEEYEDENLKVRYVHGLDLISVKRNGEVSVYLVDGLGSTRVLTDLNGEVVATYTYDAFGELLDSTGEVENDYLFAGEPFDGALEQYYLRQRFYDAETGRFTRRDTYEGRIGEPITLHKYLYGNANPVNFVDSSGLNAGGFLGLAPSMEPIVYAINATATVAAFAIGLNVLEDLSYILGSLLAESSREAIEILKRGTRPMNDKKKNFERDGDEAEAEEDFEEITKDREDEIQEREEDVQILFKFT